MIYQNHWIVFSKWVNCMVCEFYLKEVVLKSYTDSLLIFIACEVNIQRRMWQERQKPAAQNRWCWGQVGVMQMVSWACRRRPGKKCWVLSPKTKSDFWPWESPFRAHLLCGGNNEAVPTCQLQTGRELLPQKCPGSARHTGWRRRTDEQG